MDSPNYALYVGDPKGRRPLKSVALQEWKCVFKGAKEQCNDYMLSNPISQPLTSLIIHKDYEPKREREPLYRDRIKKLDKVMCHGAHQVVHTPNCSKYRYFIEFEGGVAGETRFKFRDPPYKPGEEVIFSITDCSSGQSIKIK